MASPDIDTITLAEFLTALAEDLRTDPVTTLQQACALGLGFWITPAPHAALSDAMIHRPATHMHEITLLGVSAVGDTERAAAAHWLYVAKWTADMAPQVAA